jgi:NTP pyrophosphatase (non-canonical NTP hydrolase)
VSSISDWQETVHALARSKGWHDTPLRKGNGKPDITRIMSCLNLIHSEVSEGTEAVREGRTELHVGRDGKPEGLAAELADVVIRTMDMCEALGIDLEAAIRAKHRYNQGRSHRHGGKLA